MSKPVGGRGLKAPYITTHVRTPEPVKAEVEKIIDDFRSGNPGRYIRRDELIALCDEILLQNKSTKKSLVLLLTLLFFDSNTRED
jgi:hypothetical protein